MAKPSVMSKIVRWAFGGANQAPASGSGPGVMIAVAGALRLDGIPVEFIGPESVY